MSISTEITRITTARNTIRNKLVSLGLAQSAADIDALADAVDGIVNRGTPAAEVQEGQSYTIQPGYYAGGSVSGVSGGGSYNLQSKSVTPTKQQQSVAPDTGYYGLSGVTVAAIPAAYQDVSSVTAVAGDVLANKVIVNASGQNIAGTMPNNGAVSKTLDATEDNQSYTVPAGYHSGSGHVSISLEEKSATPTTSAQNITPTSGKVLSKVTVAAIPAIYGDATNANAAAANILSGKKAVVKSGTAAALVTGTMQNKGAVSGSIDGLSTTSYTIPAGYHNGSGTVSLTSDIETALAAI